MKRGKRDEERKLTAASKATSLGRRLLDDQTTLHEIEPYGAVKLQPEIAERLNADPEFRKEMSGWNAALVLYVGDAGHTLVIREGVVVSFTPTVHNLRPRTAELRGTPAHWAALLSSVPPPFYQDFMSAIFSHGFVLAGDMEEVFSRYAGIRRMLEVMRDVCHEGSGRE